jgi:hypothetical protein
MTDSVRAALLGVVFVVGCSGRTVPRTDAPVAKVAESHAVSCRAPLGLDVVPVGDARSGSTVVMARVHGRLLAYAADEDASVVRVLDVEAPAELVSIPMPGHPARMIMLPGGRLAVTMRDRARVALFTPSPVGEEGLDPLCSLETPDEPVDLAATPDGKTLLALSDWGHTMTAFDLDDGKPRFAVDLPRSPRALLASSDGAHAYVAHAAGGALTTVDLRAPVPAAERVDLAGESIGHFRAVTALFMDFDDFVDFGPQKSPNSPRMQRRRRPSTVSRSACQGFALAELRGPSALLFSPMVEVATGDLTVQSSGYGAGSSVTPELPVMGILDEKAGKPVDGSLVAREPGDSDPPPCLLPRAAAVGNGSLYVACMGIDAVVAYDATPKGPGQTAELRRWSVPSGPTGIAIHGQRAVVWSQLGGEATILSLSGDAKEKPVGVPVKHPARTEEEDTIALGRALFHASSDRRISSDGRACASCHPDGRDDGLVWSTPGGPRQTPMLAGRLPDTAPYGWDGAGSDVEHHLGHTFARLEGKGLPKRELEALERYITTLEGPSVHAAARGDAPLARGRDVFFSAGCASCHSPESGWTDGHSHEVGIHASADTVASFDTPSLRFAGGTAPYAHDGRYPTLRALLASKDGPMGAARDMPAEDLDALEAFVRSL